MTTTMDSVRSTTRNPMVAVMSSRNFRLLWLGQGTSLLGDQFYLIAMPWLVLQKTTDPLALGAVLALMGLARAVFMLLGGAMTDRFSPRAVMLTSDVIRLALMVGLTAWVLANAVQGWMLYVFSLLFGTAAGFFMPASNSIVPKLIAKEHLQAGNAITQGTSQFAQFIGPALAGGLIAWTARSLPVATATGVNALGVALAFAFDALTFLVSVITLWLMTPPAHARVAVAESMLVSIESALRQFWQDEFIRFVLIMMACGSLFLAGTLMVGIPVLANTRLPGGPTAYGILMSAYAGGSLLGILAAGALRRLTATQIKVLLTLSILAFGCSWFALIGIHSVGLAAAVMLLIGVGSGYQMITIFTALQRRVPQHLLGRLMSLVLLFNVGLTPLSQALAGLVIKWSLTRLFGLTGLLFLLLTGWALFQPQFQMVGETLATRHGD